MKRYKISIHGNSRETRMIFPEIIDKERSVLYVFRLLTASIAVLTFVFAAGAADVVPAALVAGHAPFCWGASAAEAAHLAVILETVARMAYYTVALAADAQPIARELHDKHFLRKHGRDAYYGQVSAK